MEGVTPAAGIQTTSTGTTNAAAAAGGGVFPDLTGVYGYALLVLTYVFFIVSMYAMVVSKFMPETGNKLLDWIRDDDYYCILIPSTLVATVYTVTANWLGLKIFRHN